MLQVYSIFESLQGESRFQGLPTVFVRLAGCPLSCLYCDTREARDPSGTPLEVGEIVDKVLQSGMPSVEVTGGEPLIQEETSLLLDELVKHPIEVLLETSGAFSVEPISPLVHVVMDIKSPGSGMVNRFHFENLDHLSNRSHELKFVLTSLDDFEWMVDFCRKHSLFGREIALSPAEGWLSLSELAKWMLEARLYARLRLQLHKLIWPDGEKEL